MEAKDAVSWEELRKRANRANTGIFLDVLNGMKEVAEISFAAGKQEQLKEVVEWIQFRNYSTPEHYSHFQISKYEWQAKLKEGG